MAERLQGVSNITRRANVYCLEARGSCAFDVFEQIVEEDDRL